MKKLKHLLCILLLIMAFTPKESNGQHTISDEELIGKGTPTLFGNGYSIREEAYQAFLKLKAEALKEGITISAVSSYRNFNHQKRIWNRKYNTFISQGLSPKESIAKIIEYSTIPGTSRHHWGTDIDIYDTSVARPARILQPKNYHGNGVYCKLKDWMDSNAERYGFYLVYTDLYQRKGFKYEPWHYSYKPLSKPYLEAYGKLDISKLLKSEGLLGSDYFDEPFIKKYLSENILDINPELL
ncbi:M15 family metallopeptidase [Bizionia saleffrena]|uniref:M15 family metallopeptidase n=1 Tax=Bizionia saleffrena TaxID=291189 RepID=A0A8H2LH01_9FLAO|nr:M15 family metallopeptidase [Bizionia saleffrena]TYB78027.1 M15 family metallopeptidase [Bizionia saleffrena]